MPYIKTLLDNTIISSGVIALYLISIGAIFFNQYLLSFVLFVLAFSIHTNKTNQFLYYENLKKQEFKEEQKENVQIQEEPLQIKEEQITLKEYIKKPNMQAFVLANLVAFLLSKLTTLVSHNFLAIPFIDLGEGFSGTAHIMNTLITYVPLFYILTAVILFLKETKKV